MGILDWLFGYAAKDSRQPSEKALPTPPDVAQRSTADKPEEHQLTGWRAAQETNRQAVARYFATNPVPVADDPPETTHSASTTSGIAKESIRPAYGAAPDELWIDYATQDEPVRRRRIIPLCAAPGPYLTAIDLEKRRVRTYRLDRIKAAGRPGKEGAVVIERLPAAGAFDPADFRGTYDARSMAVFLRKGMICQLSIMVMVSETDGSFSQGDREIILEYARRESRFAVNEGWVPSGEKKPAWPIFSQMIDSLQPRREHLDCYAATINENWANARRFAVFNEFLQRLGAAQNPQTPAFLSIADEIGRIGDAFERINRGR